MLGGTRFVGRAVVADALGRGWRVTALNRGVTGAVPAGVESLRADRTDRASLEAAVDGRAWDVVVDTWAGAPWVATAAAAVLAGKAGGYAYVSSCSVYEWGRHVDESSPLVAGDPSADDVGYSALKRGAELGVLASFPHALLARAGLILGPYEDIGRLPWWLQRISRGGRVVAPGRPDRPLQYVDARDLGKWMSFALVNGISGAVDAIGASGFARTRGLLEACIDATGSDAQLVWISDDELAAAGVAPWTQLPCWVPEAGDFAGFLEVDTSRAASTGLATRPVTDTVADTWTWVQRDGMPDQRTDRVAHGLPAELERRLLTSA